MSNYTESKKSFPLTFGIFTTVAFMFCLFIFYRLNFKGGIMAKLLTPTLTFDGVFFCLESALLLVYLFFLILFWKQLVFTKTEVTNGKNGGNKWNVIRIKKKKRQLPCPKP